jgi:hypothetical protein
MKVLKHIIALIIFLSASSFTLNTVDLGDVIDTYNGVPVYYNGKISNVFGRNVTADGYNLGLKWQCVEFVKRYYYQRKAHKMSSSYGHAKDFFDKKLSEVAFNKARGLMQYKNISKVKPQVDDILVFDGSSSNSYGHIGIISKVGETEIELIQQNWGSKTRKIIKLAEYKGNYTICDYYALGWLRKE